MNADARRMAGVFLVAGLSVSGPALAHEGHGDKKSGPQAVPVV